MSIASMSLVPVFVCHECNKVFKTAYSLRRHVLIHTGELPWSCESCKKGFTQKSSLTAHKCHICKHCNEIFQTAPDLKVHLLKHVNPLECQTCHKCFASPSGLKDHMNRHLEYKPYPCKHCPKSFVTNAELKHHMVYHDTHRPHVCEECGASYIHKWQLLLHEDDHGPNQVPCPYCQLSVASARMSNHVYKCHKDKYMQYGKCTRLKLPIPL